MVLICVYMFYINSVILYIVDHLLRTSGVSQLASPVKKTSIPPFLSGKTMKEMPLLFSHYLPHPSSVFNSSSLPYTLSASSLFPYHIT